MPMTQHESSAVGRDPALVNAPTRILEAAGYLNQCRSENQSFAVLMGPDAREMKAALQAFIDCLPPHCRVARVPAPTDSNHGFLEAVLAELGFEPFESTADDLQRLLTVVLRQGAGPQAGTVILVEDAQDFGPRVFETIRELARDSRDMSLPPLIVLAGHSGLNRVLDSRGMASVAPLLRIRFDLSAPRPEPAMNPGPAETAPQPAIAALVMSLNDDVVGRFPVERDRLLIGRSQHSDICIASRFVSRQHALLIRNVEGDWLLDLKSTNGTSVNSEMVHNRLLRHGDVISIGNHRLRYENPAVPSLADPTRPTPDQLSETIVMRSIRALSTPAEAAASPGRRTSSAA